MAGEKLTKAQIELLKGIRDGAITGWHTTIYRLHARHSPNAYALRAIGLLSWSDQASRIQITDFGLETLRKSDHTRRAALLQHEGREHG